MSNLSYQKSARKAKKSESNIQDKSEDGITDQQTGIGFESPKRYYHEKYLQPESPWKCSPMTWNSVTQPLSFSKSKRFSGDPKPACLYNLSLDFPGSINKNKGTSQGYGKKSEFYDKIVKQTQSLMPNLNAKKTYTTTDQYQGIVPSMQAGKSFGHGWDDYKKNGVMGIDFKNNEVDRNYPGVGTYYPDSPLTKKMIASGIHQRLNPNKGSDAPGSTFYSPKDIPSSKHKQPTMSFGNRLDLAKPLNLNPGANQYNIKRYLDK